MKWFEYKIFIVSDFDVMRKKGFENCVPVGDYTNISNNNLKGSQTYDHIWITSSTKKTFSGISLLWLYIFGVH